jgi:DNA-binding NarL/FixJ family response regulator
MAVLDSGEDGTAIASHEQLTQAEKFRRSGYMRWKVLLADDHKVLTDGLQQLIAAKYEVVGAVQNGRELLVAAQEKKPDVIITDLSMPLLNGLDAVRTLRKNGIKSKFIILTMHADISIVVEAFRAGASAYILKHAAVEDLNNALDAVLRGRVYVSPLLPTDIITVLAEAARKPLASEDGYKLTKRQREVLQLIAEGKTMKEVGALLGISTRTAESYKYDVMDSLDIRTSAQLVQYAVRIGVITIQPLRIAA